MKPLVCLPTPDSFIGTPTPLINGLVMPPLVVFCIFAVIGVNLKLIVLFLIVYLFPKPFIVKLDFFFSFIFIPDGFLTVLASPRALGELADLIASLIPASPVNLS